VSDSVPKFKGIKQSVTVHKNKRLEVKLHVLLYGDNAWTAAFREVKSGAEKIQ
jgi:hypothetical protein